MSVANGYILPAEILLFYDKRRVLQMASDDNDVPALETDLSNSATDAYQFVNNAILSASADLDMHCQQGKRYTRANLEQAIADANASPTSSGLVKRAQAVKQLVADLAYGLILSRRGMSSERVMSMAPRYEAAEAALEKLALGITVFDLDANINAGVPTTALIGLRSYRPSFDNPMFGVWYTSFGSDPRLFGRW